MANNIDMQIWSDDNEILDVSVETGIFIPGDVHYGETLVGTGIASDPVNVSPALVEQIDNNTTGVATNATAIETEITRASAAEDVLQQNIDAESTARQNADTVLQNNIDTVANDLSTEVANRTAADTTLRSDLTAAIGDEVVARQSADTALQGNIDTVAGILSSETAARQDADTALGTRIDNEITARENADTALQNAINAETTERETDVNDLQGQIDAITAASDVTDVVGTYSALQAYNTSSLNNNDIIKVLQDETHDNETTYYRWVITDGTGAFSLIGEEGPYYTIAAADAQFVPQTRTVNGKALNGNITLSASDVGALGLPSDYTASTETGYYIGTTTATILGQMASVGPGNYKQGYALSKTNLYGFGLVIDTFANTGYNVTSYLFTTTGFLPGNSKATIGRSDKPWPVIYVTEINNGGDLNVPTTGGTLARLEDLPSAETGTTGQVYTKTATGAEWSDLPPAVTDYNDLTNRPAIDGTTLTSASTKSSLGLSGVTFRVWGANE